MRGLFCCGFGITFRPYYWNDPKPMLPHDYKKMADSLYSEFGIVAGAGDCERAFSNTLPFSRFLDYARAFGSVGG